jgi:hypothetical protein
MGTAFRGKTKKGTLKEHWQNVNENPLRITRALYRPVSLAPSRDAAIQTACRSVDCRTIS